jgi:large subunit ribosomal protein L9
MKVILTSKVKHLGNIGDIKVVADGYGKNYLLPKKMAIPYSEANYKSFEEAKVTLEKENEERYQTALKNKEKIEKLEIIVLENAGDSDKLYGSVSSLRLANLINTLLKSKDVDKTNVIIRTPIKELGVYTITLELHHDVVFNKEIIIARTREEAKKYKTKKESLEKENTEENK